MDVAGHLFVVDGDLNQLDCDAVLVPTDAWLGLSGRFNRLLGLAEDERALDPDRAPKGWGIGMRVARLLGNEGRPAVWLGNIGILGQTAAGTSRVPSSSRPSRRGGAGAGLAAAAGGPQRRGLRLGRLRAPAG